MEVHRRGLVLWASQVQDHNLVEVPDLLDPYVQVEDRTVGGPGLRSRLSWVLGDMEQVAAAGSSSRHLVHSRLYRQPQSSRPKVVGHSPSSRNSQCGA